MSNVLHLARPPLSGATSQTSTIFWTDWSSRVVFENKGIDVEITACVDVGRPGNIPDDDLPPALRSMAETDAFSIEIKPTVGDDYPTVLRQMLAGKVRYLFLEDYTGTGATRNQFIDIFAASGRTVVFKEDVDEQYRRLLRAYELDDDLDDFPASFDTDDFDADVDFE